MMALFDGNKRPLSATSAVDEVTPLLASASHEPAAQTNEAEVICEAVPDAAEDEDRPLPMNQIFLLCIARLTDPISFFSIFPFVPDMVESMHVSEADVGFYTGLIESLFSVMQMLTIFIWGRLADRYGRKPILLISTFGVAVLTTLFGASRHIWQMVFFRGIAGVFAGSPIAIRLMFAEHSTPKTQARAFSYFAFAGHLGTFAGPAIGALARPAEQYPGTFGRMQFFKDWPYLLPTLITGGICFVSFLSTMFFVKETRKPKKTDQTSGGTKRDSPVSAWAVIKTPGIPNTLLASTYCSVLGFGFTAVSPVYMFTSIPLGGFGLPPSRISVLISTYGIAQALWLLVVFPPLQRRLGTRRLLQLCGIVWPLFMLMYPLDNFLLRQGLVRAFWVLAITGTVIGSCNAMAFTGMTLALNDVSPSPSALATLNGVAMTANTALRSVSPTLFASVYAWGVKERVLQGQFGMVLLAAMASGFAGIASLLPRAVDDRPGKAQARRGGDEERDDI